MAPIVTVSNPAVVVEAVKLAEDRSGDVIVRLYESFGARSNATVTAGFAAVRVTLTDLLEREVESGRAPIGGATRAPPVELTLRPFEIVTLRLRPRLNHSGPIRRRIGATIIGWIRPSGFSR